jgi:prophage antirepressor-like protein/DNA-binding NarL/FixJ family response regulator
MNAARRQSAKAAVFAAWLAFRASQDGATSAVQEAFSAAYNAGSIQVTAAARALVPHVSPDTLARWQQGAAARGQSALAGAYGGRAGASLVDTQPEVRAIVLQMMQQRPQPSAAQVLGALVYQLGRQRPDVELPSVRTIERWLRRREEAGAAVQGRLAELERPAAPALPQLPAPGQSQERAVNARVRLGQEFEGARITVLEFKGQPVWLPGEVATALGYSEPRLLRTQIRRLWADEFIAGHDYVIVDGDDLAQLASALQAAEIDRAGNARSNDDAASGRGGHRRSLLLLTESGLNLVCMKTDKAAGRRLRRWLADEVLPQLRRTGAYALPDTAPAPPEPSLEDRRFRVQTIERIANRLLRQRLITPAEWRARMDLAAQIGAGVAMPQENR